MAAEGIALDGLIAAVADGQPLDWAGLEIKAKDDDVRRDLGSLRLIARVAEFHQSLQEGVATHDVSATGPTVSAHARDALRSGVAAATSLASGQWGAFRLLEKLGEGGNGAVYRAHDAHLEREVALKLLHPSRSPSELNARLLREGRMLARVRHPNVVTVYGADEHDGQPGLWMDLVRGSTLENLLQAHGVMSASEAALIGQDICRALAAVHGVGLVHRDVKTRNVMREDGGRIVLMDFGAGHVLHARSQFAGTPIYVAPEVLTGGDATVQSDIYSLGVVLFRLVTGAHPFTVSNIQELIEAHVSHARKSILDLRPDLPDTFAAVVEQALAHDAGKRYQSAGQMRAALGQAIGVETSGPTTVTVDRSRAFGWAIGREPIKAALAGVLTLGLAASAALRTSTSPHSPVLVRSLAVLPFREPANTDVDMGGRLAEDVSRRLNQRGVRGIGAVPSQRAADLDSDQLARQLGVDAVLRGDLKRAEGSLIAELKLSQATTGAELWSKQYREKEEATSQLPERIATDLVGVIGANSTPRFGAYAPNLAAYKAYASGKHYAEQRTRASLNLALRYFASARELDPGYPEAWVGSADTYVALGVATFGGMRPQEARRLANQAVLKAIELDPNLAEAQASLAFQSFLFDWDWEAAEDRFHKAIGLNPYYAGAHHWYANHLNAMGRQTEAMSEFERALALEPLSILIQRDRGWHLFNQRRYPEAADALRETLAAQPDYSAAHSLLGRVLVEEGQYAEGIRELEQASIKTPPGASIPLLAYAHAASGNRAAAEQELARIRALPASEYVPPYYIAVVYLRLGRTDVALRWLEKAFQEQDVTLVNLKIDPRLDPLRSTPQYQDMLRRMKFPS